MDIEKLDLGLSPHLRVTCNGNLEIRGSDRDDTRIEGHTINLEVDEAENIATVNSSGNTTIRVPENASIELLEVVGNLHLKGINGPVVLESIRGSCYARRMGALTINTMFGEARLRDINGEIVVGSVDGGITLQDLKAPCSIGNVVGDLLGRNFANNLSVENVTGDIAIRTAILPESTFSLSCDGGVTIRVQAESSVRFQVPSEVPVQAGSDVQVLDEEGQQVFVLGDGEALVNVLSAREVTIKSQAIHDDEATYTYSFSLGRELSQGIADMTADLEAQFSVLESSLAENISDRVRRHVEKRLDIAKRQVEAAKRRVEYETERTQKYADRGSGLGFSIDFDAATKSRDPVSEEERLLILKMLEEGKVSVQEAEELLSVLEGKG